MINDVIIKYYFTCNIIMIFCYQDSMKCRKDQKKVLDRYYEEQYEDWRFIRNVVSNKIILIL